MENINNTEKIALEKNQDILAKKVQYGERASIYTKFIFGLISIWLVSILAMIFIIDKHINNKDARLYGEICEQIDSIFHNRNRYIDVAYSGNKVEYSPTKIPAKPFGINDKNLTGINKTIQKEWLNDYGDLYKMYHIKWSSKEWDNPWDNADGWNLMELRADYDEGKRRLYACWYFPYAVGYKQQDYSWGYDYLPSVQSAVNEAFEFFTTNPKSNFIDDFEKGSIDRIFSEIKSNDYYFLKKNEHTNMWPGGISIVEDKHERVPVRATYMFNGYYKVFIAKSLFTSWTVTKWHENIAKDEQTELSKKWGIGISVFYTIGLIVLLVLQSKNRKKNKETLKQRLSRLCNPQQYMKPYDKEKVNLANQLY